jgi:hypothetical protein
MRAHTHRTDENEDGLGKEHLTTNTVLVRYPPLMQMQMLTQAQSKSNASKQTQQIAHAHNRAQHRTHTHSSTTSHANTLQANTNVRACKTLTCSRFRTSEKNVLRNSGQTMEPNGRLDTRLYVRRK